MSKYNFYVYPALVTSVYDGDTVTVDIDVGFGIWMRGQKIRLLGIDTPELRGGQREEGLKVRDYVRELILDKEVVIETKKDKSGKYGRWLATIWIDDVNLNSLLLSEGKAEVYK